MVFQERWVAVRRARAARAAAAWVSSLALLLAAGCGEDGMVDPDGTPDPIPTDVKTVEAFLLSHQAAWEARDWEAYGALLADRFQFWVRDDDVGAYPWAPQDFWDRLTELGMIGNLFDGAFTEEAAVQSIGFQSEALAQRQVTDATQTQVTEVTVDVVIDIGTAPNEGYRADTRLILHLEEQAGGVLRMTWMQEVQKLEPGRSGPPAESAPRAPETASLGSIKALYRGTPTQVTTPAAYLDSFAAAMNGRNHAAYDALLAGDFEFHVRDDDAGSFPWAPDDFWSRSVELQLMANLFDPGFSGGEPPVQDIQFTYQALAEQAIDEVTTEVTVDALINVITGPNNGFRTDTRFVVRLQEHGDGYLRMQRMAEVQVLEPGRSTASRAEDSSWGAIKGLYAK